MIAAAVDDTMQDDGGGKAQLTCKLLVTIDASSHTWVHP